MVGTISVDFKVLSPLDPTILMLVDNSDWFSAEDKQATIFIYPPGSSKAITQIFAKHKINTYNSVNLGLNCIVECGEQNYLPLSDGIYKLTLKSGYTDLEKTRYYLKTDTFMIEFYKEWVNTGLDYTDTKDPRYDALLDARKHLYSAEAYTLDGNFSSANREFQEAQKKFNKIRKCKECL